MFDTVLETHDHGSFNSWGRDRYWRSDAPVVQAAIDQDEKLPFLDAMYTTTIRDSRWRCDHGWDIDLDDGSTNYDIYNNLLLGRGLKLREGFRRYAYNNVIPFGGLHPHVWYQGSGDRVYSNIFAKSHARARMSRLFNKRGTTVDRNLFTTDANALGRSKGLGWDANSVYAKAQFKAPDQGVFSVLEGSAALGLGFKNFDLNKFGVKKASLRAQARTPEIPSYKGAKAVQAPLYASQQVKWLGAHLYELKGEEFSAYGVSQEDPGIVLKNVKPNSTLYKVGLRSDDVILSINGMTTNGTSEAIKAINKIGNKDAVLVVLRNQEEIEMRAVASSLK